MTEGAPSPGTGTLYVVATPIGNLGDLGPRAAEVLRTVSCVAAEDTRRAGKLFQAGGDGEGPASRRPRPRLLSLHAHNYAARIPELMAQLASGADVALVSDAGTPAVSDPGGAVVAEAWRQGFRVVPVAGPSAVAAAVSAAGFPAERYLFAGYVPKKPGRRARYFDWIEATGETAVLFETPHRIAVTLAEIAARWPARVMLLARELTKLHEELLRDTAANLYEMTRDRTWRGEITLVLAPPAAAKEGRETKNDV